jgi:hypothetical protein
MPSISAGRVVPGSGQISFGATPTPSGSTTSSTGASAAATPTTTTTLSLIGPTTGLALYDSVVQSTTSSNNITLALRNLIGGDNISITSNDGLLTIATSMVVGPTGPTGPSGGPTGPTGAASTVTGPTGPTGPTNYTASNVAITGGSITLTGMLTEFSANAITAHAGGGQAGAFQLVAQHNTITIAASSGDSVKLPISVAGLEIQVINASALPIQVFGTSTDTINGIATAVGVSQPPSSVVEYTCTVAGIWYGEGLGVGFSGSLFTESAQDTITAFAGGGQASGTQLTAQTNRITTVATAGDSVKLPLSAAGLEIVVINAGANAVQVFGSTNATIDGVAFATGVSQMKGSMTIYTSATAGAWFTNGLATGYSGSLQTMSFADTITAHAGGGQGSAVPLVALINRVTTVATLGDSVMLPASAAGLSITVTNNSANSMQVYGSGTDTINSVATATGISQMVNSIVVYQCTTAGLWQASGVGSGYSSGFPTVSYQNNISAAGSTQATATALTCCINRVATVAASTGVALPISAGGLSVTVVNAGANSMSVYPFNASGDTINGAAANAAFALGTNKTAAFTCAAPGVWHSVLSA